MKINYHKLLLFTAAFGFYFGANAQDNNPKIEISKEKIVNNYDQEKLKTLTLTLEKNSQQKKAKALAYATQHNIPVLLSNERGVYAELQEITADGNPIYYSFNNVDAAVSTRTNYLNSGGGLGLNLNGNGMTAHVWDGGIARASHQEYDGPGGNNRYSTGDNTTSLNYHAAHVTGTIMASGVNANAKGMAWQAKAIGYDWNNDEAEATTAAANGMLVSNHSYGYVGNAIPDAWFGQYIEKARNWDQILYNAPNYLMVVAAGNDGTSDQYNASPLQGNSAYDKLSGQAVAKNNLVVANGQDAVIDANGNLTSVIRNSSSSEGPTDDLRIKPDIMGNGTGVYSTYDNSDTAYNSITGTSMASPNVCGSALLLQEHYNNLNGSFMKAATLKGLILHTADDTASYGPDAETGWGLMNTKKAAETISENSNGSIISELTLNQGETYQITVTSDNVNPLLASISWTDPAGNIVSATNSSTPVLVNDLDIRVSNGTTYTPWKLTGVTSNGTGDNVVDPFERVDINGAAGTYTITVSHKGNLSSGSQNFSLIVTGLSNTNQTCNALVPSNIAVTDITTTTANISWNNIAGASYTMEYREAGTTNWTALNTDTASTSLNNLQVITTYEIRIKSTCPNNTSSAFSNTVTFTTLDNNNSTYCDASGTNTSYEYIKSVALNTINNTSSGSTSGYSDFTSISTTLSMNDTYSITITPGWPGGTYNEGYAVWIDYNADGDFLDSGELVFNQTPTNTNTITGTFTVPNNLSEVTTRMRVAMKYNGTPTACEVFNYGEVEDYSITLAPESTGGGTDICDGVSPYTAGYYYPVGAKVTYQNYLFQRTYTGWSNLGACGTNAVFSDTDELPNIPEQLFTLELYPNPANGEYINVKISNNKEAYYSIYNLVGQQLKQGKLDNTININSLQSGVYILEVTSQNKTVSARFIKQ